MKKVPATKATAMKTIAIKVTAMTFFSGLLLTSCGHLQQSAMPPTKSPTTTQPAIQPTQPTNASIRSIGNMFSSGYAWTLFEAHATKDEKVSIWLGDSTKSGGQLISACQNPEFSAQQAEQLSTQKPQALCFQKAQKDNKTRILVRFTQKNINHMITLQVGKYQKTFGVQLQENQNEEQYHQSMISSLGTVDPKPKHQ